MADSTRSVPGTGPGPAPDGEPGPPAAANPSEAYRQARDRLLALRDDFDQAVAEFSFPALGPTFNWAHDWFDVVAPANDNPALIVTEEDGAREAITFAEMARRSNQVARWLGEVGVGKGDPVILMLGNQVELWETMLGVMKLGAVIMPTTTALGPADLTDRIVRGGAKFVVCNPADTVKFEDVGGDLGRICVGEVDGWANLHDARQVDPSGVPHPGTGPDDLLLLYFTSGTTSRPKLVAHTQVSYPVGHLSTMYWIGLRPGDVHLNISSPGWAKHAWSCFFAPWSAESTIFVYNYSRFDAAALQQQLRTEQVTTFCAPPTVWRMLIKSDLSSKPPALREMVSAGEPLNPEVIEQVRTRWGITIRDGYGQTETTASVANAPGTPVKPGSMGRPLPGVPVAIVDVVTGEAVVGPGEGEICLDVARAPVSLMAGYLDDAGGESDALSGRYYHTGDVASVDGDGYVTFIGRTDDVFKSSDYKVSPFEVESVLIEHPAVAEAAVVPAPDEVRLAVPKAYVLLAPGFEPSQETAFDILRFARRRLPPFQRVRRIEFFDLPKTISGKIRRVELRSRETEHAGEPIGTEWRDDQLPELQAGR